MNKFLWVLIKKKIKGKRGGVNGSLEAFTLMLLLIGNVFVLLRMREGIFTCKKSYFNPF